MVYYVKIPKIYLNKAQMNLIEDMEIKWDSFQGSRN